MAYLQEVGHHLPPRLIPLSIATFLRFYRATRGGLPRNRGSDSHRHAGLHPHRHPRKAEAPARIVDHIYLAHIRPRLQLRQRHIELKRHRPALRNIDPHSPPPAASHTPSRRRSETRYSSAPAPARPHAASTRASSPEPPHPSASRGHTPHRENKGAGPAETHAAHSESTPPHPAPADFTALLRRIRVSAGSTARSSSASAVLFFISGTCRSVSKLPIAPVWFSRTTNFRWYLPGASVNPVEY